MTDRVNASSADLVTLEEIGRTVGSRPILALRIAAKESPNAPRLLVVGGHHAREWIASEVPFLIAERLIQERNQPTIRPLLDELEIWVVPVLNPDGSDFSHLAGSAGGDRRWRKNRRPVGRDAAGRTIFGVDPNRNYDIDFRGGGGTSGALAAENYPGEEAFSERESQAIRDLTGRFIFSCAVSYHCYSQEVLYPFGTTLAPCDARCAAQLARSKRAAGDMAAAMGVWHGTPYVARSTLERYPTSGDCADWLLSRRGIAAVTVELPPRSYDDLDDRFMLDNSEIEPIFEGAWNGLLVLARSALEGP